MLKLVKCVHEQTTTVVPSVSFNVMLLGMQPSIDQSPNPSTINGWLINISVINIVILVPSNDGSQNTQLGSVPFVI